MPFSGMHVHVALIQPICAKLVMHGFLWVIGHMSDGQHQCFAKQVIRGDLVVPFQFCCTVSRPFCLSIAVRPVGGRIGRHVVFPLSSPHAHRHHPLACSAHAAQLWVPPWGNAQGSLPVNTL